MAVITDLLTSLGYHPIATLTSVFIVYQLVLALYCLTLHPLAHIPGPRIAAITYFYEFYYDFILGGQYTFKIARLHSKYGPILRISPCEVHINDPDFYDQIYTGTSEPREKWDRVMARMGNPSSHVATAGVVQHRARKAPLNQFFSQKSVFGLESLFVEKADRLCERIDEWKETGKVLNVQYAMSSFVIDVITEYSFAQSYGSLDHPEFAPYWPDCVDAMVKNVYIGMYFSWFTGLMKKLPSWLLKRMSPGTNYIRDFQEKLREQVASIMDLDAQGKEPNSTHPTIFHGFLNDPDLPLADRTAEHFVHEAQAIVVAGQITTGYLLSTTCWYILSTPRVLARVKTELFEVMPDPATLPSLKAVEDLPYLSAVVAEGHRLTHGISHRSPRLSNFPIQFGEYSIPPRTPVGMTQMLIHQNSFLFSDPFTFKPERWLDIPNVHPNMHPLRKYLLSFSRGTRSCLGMHLAQAEIYMALAAVFRRFDFDIFGTTQADIDIVADFLTPFPREGSKGLRVLVR